MGYEFTLDDVRYLTSDTGAAALARVGERELSTRTRLADIGWVRTHFGDRTAVLVETVLLRRKADAKIPGAARWILTDDAVQQSTPATVAAHRARRLAGRRVHDVTCSIGTELAELVGVAETVVGSRRLCRAVRRSVGLSLLGSAAGTLLTAYLAALGAYALMSPLALEAFLLLWTLPVLLMSDLAGRY